MSDALVWAGIAVCISQSAALSGLNLALFSLSRLRLETAAHGGDARAARVLALREDANATLATILWGNVGVNVLLTLLADSVLTGLLAFVFSTVVITFVGEIIPQAYFSRHALRVASWLSPLLRVYRVLLWPVAKPIGLILDRFIGRESTPWFREKELRAVLRHHARNATEVGRVEALGAINFLTLDDLPVVEEGERLEEESVIALPHEGGRATLPALEPNADHPFVRQVAASGRKWVIITDPEDQPRAVLNAHLFLRTLWLGGDPWDHLHRPLVTSDPNKPLGKLLVELVVRPEHPEDDVIDEDIIIVWAPGVRRIVTGSDLLGRLLRGITRRDRPGTTRRRPNPSLEDEAQG